MSYAKDQMKARPAEARVVRKAWDLCKDNGTPIVSVVYTDGGGQEKVSTQEQFLEAAFNLDEFYAYTSDDGYLFFVMGEDDIIADYTMDLDTALAPLF